MKPRSRSSDSRITERTPTGRPELGACEAGSTGAGEMARPDSGPLQRWVHFWLQPTDPAGMHGVRVLAGLLFLCWLLGLASHIDSLFGLQGWFDLRAYREVGRLNADIQAGRLPPGTVPVPLSWSLVYLCGTNSTALRALYWGSVAVLALFTVGIAPRLTAIGAWLVVASFIANPATSFDADYLLLILAFYLMLGYVFLGQWSRKQTIAERILGSWSIFLFYRWLSRQAEPGPATPSHAATAMLRLVQVHFCIVIVTSAVHKLQFGDWWSGVAFWYPLHPPFQTTVETLRAYNRNPWQFLFVLSLVQYLVLAWQIFFPLFAWRTGAWRGVLLGGAVVGWLGLVFLFQLPLFGPVLLIACLSYLTAGEWRWLLNWRQIPESIQEWWSGLFRRRPELVQAGEK